MNRFGLIFPAFLALILAGCDNSIEPLLEEDATPFAIHGVLDMHLDRQFVRVEAVRPTVLSETEDLTDVSVFTTDLDTGQLEMWQDSLVTLDNGGTGHLYHADFRPTAGHTYRFVVRRDGQPDAMATTRLPAAPEFLYDPTRGDSLDIRQKMYLLDLTEQPRQLTLKYTVVDLDTEEPRIIDISYGEVGTASSNGWMFDVRLSIDRLIIMRALNRDREEKNVRLRNLAFSITIQSEEFNGEEFSGNEFSGNELSGNAPQASGAETLGFFGSVGHYQFFWQLDTESIKAIGFIDDQVTN